MAGAGLSLLSVAGAAAQCADAPPLRSELLMDLVLDLGPAQNLAPRRIVPVTGGTFEGPDVRGIVLPGGADWVCRRPDGTDDEPCWTHRWRAVDEERREPWGKPRTRAAVTSVMISACRSTARSESPGGPLGAIRPFAARDRLRSTDRRRVLSPREEVDRPFAGPGGSIVRLLAEGERSCPELEYGFRTRRAPYSYAGVCVIRERWIGRRSGSPLSTSPAARA